MEYQQQTIGSLIDLLSQHDPSIPIKGVAADVMSYRGFYEELAIAPGEGTTAGELLESLTGVLGKELEGYKGGTYLMGSNTPVHFAAYGEWGGAVVVGVVSVPPGLELVTVAPC